MANEDIAPVKVEKDGHIAVITLQNPPYNVLTSKVVDALADTVVKVTEDPDVRCMILMGSGDRAFSSGANVREMATMTVKEARRYSAKGQALTNLLERSPIPVIAAVRGFCLGGGCEISLACDFIVAADDAVFAQPEINVGVLPGWGCSRRLTRAIGVARARHWILTGEKVPAARAWEDGLVDKVVPANKLVAEAKALALTLASKGAVALAAAKYAVNYASDATRLLGLEYERDLWGVLFQTEDQKEGMTAFLEKREPHFQERADWSQSARGEPWDEQRSVFEAAKKDAKLDPLVAESAPWLHVWRKSSEEWVNQVVSISMTTANTYQEWVERAWKLAALPYKQPTGNHNNEQQ